MLTANQINAKYKNLDKLAESAISELYVYIHEARGTLAHSDLSRKIRMDFGYLNADGSKAVKAGGNEVPTQLRKDISRIVGMLRDLECKGEKFSTITAIRTAHKAWKDAQKVAPETTGTETETAEIVMEPGIPADMVLVSRVEYESLLAFWNANKEQAA